MLRQEAKPVHPTEEPADRPVEAASLQTDVRNLEHNRFSITPESLQVFKTIRNELPRLQEAKPWVQGVGFYGSRTRGQERPDSDIDMIVYSTPNFDERKTVTEEDVHQLVRSSGVKVDLHPVRPKTGEVANVPYMVDISPHALQGNIRSFLFHARVKSRVSGQFNLVQRGTISSLFYPAVGDGVYRARKYVLDQLASIPEGDAIMALIAEALNNDERVDKRPGRLCNPRYSGYPMTVDEARQYFVTKDYDASEYPGLTEEEYKKAIATELEAENVARRLQEETAPDLADQELKKGFRKFIGRLGLGRR